MVVSILAASVNHTVNTLSFFSGIFSQEVDEAWEVIIGVDKSSDRSREICIVYQEKYPDKVKEYHNGKKGVVGLFMGEIMKKSKGKINPQDANKLETTTTLSQ